jgi:site-specific recombinase XerD/ribosomal protein L40E
MKAEIDIHNYDKRLKSILEKIMNSKELDETNKLDIIKFEKQCQAEGISSGRIVKYMYTLRNLALLLKKPFREATKDDIINVVGKIESRRDYTDWTKHDYKVTLKKFYRWLRGFEKPDYPEEVKWIKTTKKKGEILPEEILTQEEIEKMAKVTDNLRDKAFILTLYESGCRVSELLTLKIKNVDFDDYGAVLIVRGKNGMRRVRIIASEPELRNWLDNHPFKNNPEAFLWIVLGTRNKFEVMSYAAVNHLLRRLAERAGIKKKVNPHAFRHARATHLANQLTEAQLKQLFGWTQSSKQTATYVHLSGRDIDEALLQLHGLEVEKKKEAKFKVRICPRCGEKNSPVAKYCQKCSFILDAKIALEREERIARAGKILDYIIEHEEYRKELEKLFEKIGKEKLRKII